MEQINIACIGAHPDDVELSMGGTIMSMIEAGHNVFIIDLTDGEPTPCGSKEIRKLESDSTAKMLGVKRITLDLPNRYIQDTIEARKILAEVLRKVKCKYIFTHYEFDDHPDHSSACKIVEGARFYSKLTKSDIPGDPYYPSKIIYFFPNHVNLNLLPSFLVDISRHLGQKKSLLECYESQFLKKGKGKVIEDILLTNKYHGSRIQKEAAEPFYIRDGLDILEINKLFTNQQ